MTTSWYDIKESVLFVFHVLGVVVSMAEAVADVGLTHLLVVRRVESCAESADYLFCASDRFWRITSVGICQCLSINTLKINHSKNMLLHCKQMFYICM